MTTSMVATFEAERSRLFDVAYRLLGSVADSEDVVQEAYLRWADQAGRPIDNPAAFLTTVVSRLALDRLRSARHRREQYVGPWLPEPVATTGPDDDVVLAESLTIGFLAVLERLGPVERAVFVLHDVFALPFAEVAGIVDRSEANCRQIARRARERVRAEGPGARPRPAPSGHQGLIDAFLDAVVSGDVARLEQLLAEDVVHVSDGGADHHAARRPVVGRDRVARLFVNLAKRTPERAGVELLHLNGEPSVMVTVEGRPFVTITLGVTDGLITNIWAVINPDKIAHLGTD
ncbi:MAG: RNA polymerase sigma factor SigJ [Actinomycetota bacterium]